MVIGRFYQTELDFNSIYVSFAFRSTYPRLFHLHATTTFP